MFGWWRDVYTILTLLWLLLTVAAGVAVARRRRVRTFLPLWLIAAGPWAFITYSAWRNTGFGTAVLAPASALKLQVASGGSVSLNELRGRVVLLDFWATWCAPCRASAPAIAQLAGDLSSRGLVVVGVSGDEDEAAWRRYLDTHREQRLEALDSAGTVARAFDAQGKPTFILVDRQSRVRWRQLGGTPYSYLLLRHRVGRLLREGK